MATQTVHLRFLRMAPRKVRAVADLMRGMSVNEAEAQLMYERRRAAKPLLKLLRSAKSAAQVTKKLNPEAMIVEAVFVDKGPMLKRYLPRARGSASHIHKVMSHVTLTLSEKAGSKAKFAIIIKKKAKKPEGEKKARKAKKDVVAPEEETKQKEQKAPGIFKRVFRRKSV